MDLFRFFRPGLVAATFLGAGAVAVPAADLSGVYENTGSFVSSATSPTDGTVSFQGLLELNFDYQLTRALHAPVNRVTIRQTETHFRIECRDADNHVTWSGIWEKGMGYTTEEDRVNLIFHAPRFLYDGFLFTLRLVPNRDLIFVDVQRIRATPLGSNYEAVGSFLFGRLARE